MGDQRGDDTREPRREPKTRDRSRSYYYDDATGYRVYRPDDEDESENGDDESENGDDEAAQAGRCPYDTKRVDEVSTAKR